MLEIRYRLVGSMLKLVVLIESKILHRVLLVKI